MTLGVCGNWFGFVDASVIDWFGLFGVILPGIYYSVGSWFYAKPSSRDFRDVVYNDYLFNASSWLFIMTTLGLGDWFAAFGFLLQGQDMFFDFVAEVTFEPLPRMRRVRRSWFSRHKRYSGKKWRAIQRAIAMYKAEVNKHRHRVARRFYVDRAAATRRMLKNFKRWYYLNRLCRQLPSRRSGCWNARHTRYTDWWRANYRAYCYSNARNFHQTIARGFDSSYVDPTPTTDWKELAEFINCDGVPLHQQGRFHLPRHSSFAIETCAIDFADRIYGEEDDSPAETPEDDSPAETPVPSFDYVLDSGANCMFVPSADDFISSDGTPYSPSAEYDSDSSTDSSSDGYDSVDESSTFDEDGHFALSGIASKFISEFVEEHVPDPSRSAVWVGMTARTHRLHIKAALKRAQDCNAHCKAWRFANAGFGRSDVHVADEEMDTVRDKRYYETPVVFDTGASFGLTPFRQDFITYEETNISVKGIGSENVVVGFGTVLYRCTATDGSTCFIPGLAYHLPSTDIRLFSPQAYFQHYGGRATIDAERVQINLRNSVTDPQSKHTIELPIDKGSNLPLFRDAALSEFEQQTVGRHFRTFVAVQQEFQGAFVGSWDCTLDEEDWRDFGVSRYRFTPFQALGLSAAVTIGANLNLDAAQKEFLDWHHKLGCGLARIKKLMRTHTRTSADGTTIKFNPVIVTKDGAANCKIPKCGTCGIASAQAKGTASDRKSTVDTSLQNVMTKGKLKPGELVSMDSITISIPGRPHTGRGGDRSAFYQGATIFHDAATNIIKVYPQRSIGASDTLLSKQKFEDFLFEHASARVLHYHSDQGIFVSKAFKEDCTTKHQKQTFSAVGAKWQNGLAESAVKTVFWRARHYLLHAALHWSTHGADDPSFWPQAVEYSTWIHNRLPSATHGFSPLELLTGSLSDHTEINRAHVWGAPVYVLDARLQDGHKVPKFAHRAHIGQFVGFSDETSSTAAVVRNLCTQHLSTQLHVMFDDRFETVIGLLGTDDNLDDSVAAIWDRLFNAKGSRDWYVDPVVNDDGEVLEYSVPFLDDMWLTPDEQRIKREAINGVNTRMKIQRQQLETELRPTFSKPDQQITFDVPDDTTDLLDTELESGTVDFVGDDGNEVAVDGSVELPTEGGMSRGEDFATAAPPVTTTTTSPPSQPSRPQRVRKPTWKAREAMSNLATTLTSAFSSVSSDTHPNPIANSDANSKKVTISHRTWAAALNFTPSQMATLSYQEKEVLRRTDHPSFEKYSLTLQSRKIPIGVQQAWKTAPSVSHPTRENLRRSAQTVRTMLFEVNTLEELMNSPLSDLITLAVNECIYSGPEVTPVCQDISPHFLNAKTGVSREDNPGWREAMSGDEAPHYWEAAKKEIATLEGMEAWDVVDKSSVPKGHQILKSLWTFKRKRTPAGVIKKYKARLTARGDMQVEGVDYNEVWAPVCSWTTVRMMFTLQLVLGLASASADVSCAFLHAPIDDEEVYLEMPKGFELDGKCLKLKKSLYGLRQSPRNFFLYLSEKMGECQMRQSKHDPCLFMGDKVIAVCYVDDLLFWAKDPNDITELMLELREKGLDLEKEDDAAGFLGVDVKVLETDENGRATKLELTQAGLIDRIIDNLGLNSANVKYTPAKCEPLTRDPDGEPCQEDFNVAAVVGQLLYLTGHTRPEMAYAVNCVARYMFSPKRSHELALKQIGRYLKATKGKGMIITPSTNVLSIEAFPDSDFGGLYGHERHDDPACVKSRTGFVILAANCPILWKSQLQSKTALSTMEAEISALAHCCKELFPLIELAKSLAEHFKLDPVKTTMNVTIHEDNAAALILGNTLPPGYTSRSKFFHLETIWFREEIAKRGITLQKVDTKEQLGDLFTKGLSQVTFEYLRKKLMGW